MKKFLLLLACLFVIRELNARTGQNDEVDSVNTDDRQYQERLMSSLENDKTIDIYSEEDPELLLAQIEDNGLITSYQYDPFSKQCIAILGGCGEHQLFRCFCSYDDQGFLKQVIYDDGQGQEPKDLTGVTRRHLICLQTGHEFPLLGKPLNIENYVWKPNCSDAKGVLVHKLSLHYDSQGQLVSTINSQGEMNFETPVSAIAQCDYVNSNLFYDQISIDQIWDGIAHSFFSGFYYLQLSAHQTKMKWNAELQFPAPIVKALEQMCIALFGESTYLLMGPHFEATYVDCYGQREVSDKVRVTFINGILNTRNMMLLSLDIISESHGGIKVHYVFRPTEGWIWDISRAIMIRTAFRFGFRSLHAHLLARLWRELIQEMGGIGENGVIMHYAHSLGGSETDRARELLSPEEQKMIRVVTFGSPTFVRNMGFQSVINIVSVNDGVSSFFLEPLGHIRNYFDPESNVYWHGSFVSAPYWPTDHLLNGPTYGSIMRNLGEKFLAEFSLSN